MSLSLTNLKTRLDIKSSNHVRGINYSFNNHRIHKAIVSSILRVVGG